MRSASWSRPQQALASDAPVIRDEKEGQSDNHIYHWESGDAEATDRAFAQADRVVSLDTFYPRSHPAPLETCGCIADVNSATGQTTIYMTSQAPHAIRTVFALVTGLPEENIRIVSPDLGGGFGNKVPVYPGYVVATAASLLLGRPVKWIEDRSENLISTGFARDFHMHGELALKDDGTMLGLRTSLLADEGAFHADAQPSKLKVGLLPRRDRLLRHAGRARRRRRLLHEQGARRGGISMLVPRHGGVVHDRAARPERRVRARMDPADLRKKNFIRPEQFPYETPTGLVYDSGDYRGAMDLALETIGYDELRKEQEQKRADGKLLGHRHRIVHRGGRSRSPQATTTSSD